jgi:propionyl-CoA synthetase
VDYDAVIYGSEEVPAAYLLTLHIHYTFYTSGTTGKPKGVVQTRWLRYCIKIDAKNLYQRRCFLGSIRCGLGSRHSFIVYGPLINRNSSTFFETNMRRPIDIKVNVFTATAIRAIRKEDPNGDFIKQYDLSSLKTQF